MEPVKRERLWWPAPAKLNLMLHITGRREDGYHLLQTVFQLLDYGDRLAFDVRQDGQINNLNLPAGVSAQHDLASRAARLLQQHSQTPLGADIHLDKRIPMGGGLGGGSSDAATTLLALNHLWGCALSIEQLAALGAQLGADVPVFVRGHSAWAEGVGDIITPIQLPPSRYLVICPPVHLSTASMFAHPMLQREQPRMTLQDFYLGARDNAFTPVARAQSAEIDALFNLLEPHATPQLTGSGAAVFCAFAPEDPALEHLQNLIGNRWPYFVAQGQDVSPTHRLLHTLHKKGLHNVA